MEYFLLLLIPVLLVKWFLGTDKSDSCSNGGESNGPQSFGKERKSLFGPGLEQFGLKAILSSDYRKQLPEMLNMEDVVHDGDWTYGTYQGGYFAFWSDEEGRRLEIQFNNIYTCALENLYKVMEIEDRMNDKEFWTTFHNVNYDAKNGEQVEVSLRHTFVMYKMSLQQVADTLKSVLPHAFVVRDTFMGLRKQIDEANPDFEEHHQNELFSANVDFIRNRARMGFPFSAPEQEAETTPESLWKVSEIIACNMYGAQGCLNAMTLIVDGKAETITDLQQIQKFSIRDYVLEHFDGQNLNSIILRLDFEHQDLLIHMRKAKGCTAKTLFYDISTLRSSCGEDGGGVGSTNMGEIRLADTNEDYWEAKYMVDDAMDKWNSGRHNELTDEQRMVVDCVEPQYRTDIYWAHKYYNKKCYAQSLFYFSRVFGIIQNHLPSTDTDLNDLYGRIAFSIALIYMNLRMNEQACYYLHIARGEGYGVIELGYCLQALNSPEAMDYVRNMHRDVVADLQKEENAGDEGLLSLYIQANRLLILSLINKGTLFEAKSLLQDMKSQDFDTEFVEEKLALLEEMMNRQKGEQ